ncbi:Mis6-domain-containing protein [Schizothecium vesticola]|uniref:Mis6-domain-containing protein n=1 Tax=Schizothecium vesticola TaxID=314040 RepID=A0AA40KD70_9PEZI|nr:Mis6-domain-containing protein [Schizothecium vesticola]
MTSPQDPDPDVDMDMDNLGIHVDDIENAAIVPAKRRKLAIKPTVERAVSVLYDRGALPEELGRLIDLVTLRSHLDQASLGSLIRNLYPAGKIDKDIVLKVVGALGHGQRKPSLPLQSLLLRWLVMVYHLLGSSAAVLFQAYAVIFNLLDTAAIRPQLCHLLALITRRKHVRPFRIQSILSLARQTGSDPALLGLLRVFKNYYPEIIVGEVTKGRAAAFKHPDLQWRVRLDEIRNQHMEHREDGIRNGFAVNHVLAGKLNRSKLSVIPHVHTPHSHENSVTLEEIEDAESFVENLDKLELPAQLVAILADPLLQKLMLLRPNAEGFSRISNWVTGCLIDVAGGDADPSLLLDLVDIVHDYVVCTKSLPPVFLAFFRTFFRMWDGRDKREAVLDTLSYVPISDDEGYQQIIGPLEQSILDGTPDSQLAILDFHTRLLRRWRVLMETSNNLPPSLRPSISALISHVNKLALTLTQTSPTVGTHLAILDFYQLTAALFSTRPLLPRVEISIPPPLLVYTLHFGHSLPVLARLCGILAVYKRAWESLMAPPTPRPLTPHEHGQIAVFNGFLMDLCNCLWRSRALAITDLNSQGCRIPRALEPVLAGYLRDMDAELALASAFGLSHAPVLSMQAIAYVREREDEQDGIRARHAGPVTQASLAQLQTRGGLVLNWHDYRAGVLGHLEKNGFGGVSELMYNTMKNLMKGKK